MLKIVSGHALGQFVEKALSPMAPFGRIVFCSPFIDAGLRWRIVEFAERADGKGVRLRIVTSPDVAEALGDELARQDCSSSVRVLGVRGLHAKAYLATQGFGRPSVALVTSANLTHAGCEDQIEVGVLASTTCDAGTRLVVDLAEFLTGLGQMASSRALDSCTNRREVWKRN
jgi:hypothetical protein